MEDSAINPPDENALAPAPQTPEDVAILYSWANVEGGTYHDFSTTRKEYRAQQRQRALEARKNAGQESGGTHGNKANTEREDPILQATADGDESTEQPAGKSREGQVDEQATPIVNRSEHSDDAGHVDDADESVHSMPLSDGEEVRSAAAGASASGTSKPLHPVPRIRNRESATDVRSRTTRRPRGLNQSPATQRSIAGAIGVTPQDSSAQTAYEALQGPPRRYAPEESSGFRTVQPPRTHYDDHTFSPVPSAQGASAGREDRPAWLLRDARPGESVGNPQGSNRAAGPDGLDAEMEGRRSSRDAFDEFLARSAAEVTPRTTGSRPARSVYLERDEAQGDRHDARPDTLPTPAPEALHEGPHADEPGDAEPQEDIHARNSPEHSRNANPEEEAGRRREDRRRRLAAGLTREVPGMVPAQEDNQAVSASDGGLNLPPLRQHEPLDALPPLRDLPRMRDRGAYREESVDFPEAHSAGWGTGFEEGEAATVREMRPSRAVLRASEGAAPMSTERIEETPETAGGVAAPRSERRRYARSSSPRGLEAPLVSSHEYRVAARAAELAERGDRTRSQAARREVELREDFRNDLHGTLGGRSSGYDGSEAPGHPGLRASDTLQQSQERVAARWYALKGLIGSQGEQAPELPLQIRTAAETTAPMLSVVALSGGVGKTSLVATLGRVLSSLGEKVLLADATTYGLLPYYFGARELRPDVVRTFSPPPGSTDAPVYMVNYQTDRLGADEIGQAKLVEEIGRHSRGTQRVLLDLNGSSAWLARRLARLHSSVLVPITPDMSSVLSIQGVERFFAGTQDGEGRPVSPYYVLNQFDASLPLHLDVREVLRQQLGNRLLPVIIRRSHAVSEALAEGMTVIDYAPQSAVAEDYAHLAEWVRDLAAPASVGLRRIRWSER